MEWRIWESKATRIARHAARWRVEMDEPESQAQVEAFEAWLAADPAHHRAYVQMDRIATASRNLSHRQAPSPTVFRFRPAFGIAASVAALAIGAIWFAKQASPAFATIENHGEAVKTVTLADGSAVTLDTASSIETAKSPKAHRLRLKSGRLRVVVHLPAGQSMSVETPVATLVISQGTLDLALVDGGVRVRLVAGQATLQSRRGEQQAVTLPLSQPLVVSDGASTAAPPSVDDSSWVLARVAFDDAPLSSVLARANGSNDPKIEVTDAAIAAMRVTAVLDLRDPHKLARKLAAALDLRAIDRGDRLILSRP